MKKLMLVLGAVVLFLSPVVARGDFVVGDRMIRVEGVVEGGISDVWGAWTTSDGLAQWFGVANTLEMRPGGPFEIYFSMEAPEGSRGSEGCKVLSYLPQRMLSFDWNAPLIYPDVRNGGINTIVVVAFEPLGAARTRVVLRHHGWPDDATTTEQWDGTYAYFEEAWPSVMASLQEHFDDDGEPAPNPNNAWVYLIVDLSRPDLLDTITDAEKMMIQDHFIRLRRLASEGTVVLAGPCTDDLGPAIVIFRADDEAEARAMMESDPAVKGGIFIAELHPMRLSLLVGRDN